MLQIIVLGFIRFFAGGTFSWQSIERTLSMRTRNKRSNHKPKLTLLHEALERRRLLAADLVSQDNSEELPGATTQHAGVAEIEIVQANVSQQSAVSYSPEYTTINGRNFGYYVPDSYDSSTPTPLLFMFHGMGGDSSEQSGGSAENSYYGWQTTAHQNGFIVLFPESLGYFRTWDLGGGGSSSDLSFVDDMIGWASTNYNISTSQIFTTGHSWGAYFSYYVARYRSDDIAAFGAHSGGLGGAFFLGSTPSVPTGPSPTPTLNGIVLHAVDDGIVPYSNSQNLYDDLVANGHNVYDDGIGADGIIEVDGWGPDNHRYRKQHNQTQWDFFLTVAPNPVTSNQPPEFNQPLDLVLNEDTLPQSIALTGISSGDGIQQPVRVTATSSNPSLIPEPVVSYVNPSDTGSLVVAPNSNQHGAATITVTVEDGGLDSNLETAGDNAIVSQAFEVTVTSVNDPGSFSGNTSATGSEDDSAITGTIVFTDAIDGDSVPNYTITSESSSGLASIDAATGAWSYVPNANFNGSDSFTVTVTDDEGHTESQVVSLMVTSANDSGSFSGNTSATGSEDGSAITGTIVFTDAIDGDSVPNYTITSESSSGLASIDAATGAWSYVPNANFNGSDSFTVTVTDDEGHTESQVVNLIVEAVNDAPTLDALTDITRNEGDGEQTVSLTGITAGGGEIQLVSITAVSDNTGLIPDPTVDFDGQSPTGTLKFTPPADQFGTATITVLVEDGGLDNDLNTQEDNGTVSRAFDVVLVPVNDEPMFDPVADLVLPENSLTHVLDITGISAGAGENQPLQITTSSSNTSVVLHPTITSRSVLGSDTRLLAVTPVPDQYGITAITVTVEDGGLDLDLNTAEDNAIFSRTFDVTVTPDTDTPPSQVTPHGRMFIHETLSVDALVSYQLPAINVNGEAINGLPNRITVTSSNTALIRNPTVLYTSFEVPSSLSFTPEVNANGTATLSIQVEDGGPDNDFATTEDNRQATHQVEVNILEVISNQGSAILAKDSTENLYVNTQPVIFQDQQQAQSNIAGFAAIGASSEDGENALLVERSSVTNRLVTDEAWRITGMFDSLQNETSPVLDLAAREVSSILNIAAVSGAYEINGANNPTLIVRRGQTYTFNLNTAGHPFYLQTTTGSGYQPNNAYTDGFDGNGETTGMYTWTVPLDSPNELFYQCEFHGGMNGRIVISDLPSNGT